MKLEELAQLELYRMQAEEQQSLAEQEAIRVTLARRQQQQQQQQQQRRRRPALVVIDGFISRNATREQPM